jgi:hypothetical protein
MSAELYAALALARAEIGGVHKDRRNDRQGYDYVSAEAIIAASTPVLAKHGLVFFPKTYAVDAAGMILNVDYVLGHSSGAEMLIKSCTPLVQAKFRGGGEAPLDKVVGAAKTYDYRYALRAVCGIPQTEEGEDVDSRDDSAAPRESRAQVARPADQPVRAAPAPAPTRTQEHASDRSEVATVRARLSAHREGLGSAYSRLVPVEPTNMRDARAALARCDAYVDEQLSASSEPDGEPEEPGADDDTDLPWAQPQAADGRAGGGAREAPPVPPAGPAPTAASIYDAARKSGAAPRIGAILAELFGPGTRLDALNEDQRRQAFAVLSGGGRAVVDAARAANRRAG